MSVKNKQNSSVNFLVRRQILTYKDGLRTEIFKKNSNDCRPIT